MQASTLISIPTRGLFASLIICLFSTTVQAYTTIQSLSMEVDDTDELIIETRSGDLIIQSADSSEINVELTLDFRSRGEDEVRELLDEYLEFNLARVGDKLVLTSYLDYRGDDSDNDHFFSPFSLIFGNRSNWNDYPSMDLVITIPANLNVEVNDGSGNIYISDLSGDLEVNDGSGNIAIENVTGKVLIDDGSGNIVLENAGSNVEIDDGSGNIKIEHVAGFLTITDGSGEIDIYDANGGIDLRDGSGSIYLVENNSTVNIRDGSGQIRIRDQVGTVTIRDGSGNIDVQDVEGDVILRESGSGSVRTRNISGELVGDYD